MNEYTDGALEGLGWAAALFASTLLVTLASLIVTGGL